MIPRTLVPWLVLTQLVGLWPPAVARGTDWSTTPAPPGSQTGPTNELLQSLDSLELRDIAADVLHRSPEIARAKHLAAAAAARAPQVRALPDPVAALNVFVFPPETRAGPQQLSVSLQQTFPWFGKLALRERVALFAAAAAEADIERLRLDHLLETRRIAYELGFLDAHEGIVRSERGALVRYERAAQARYATGTGLQQEIVRIQAQITRTDTLLLEINERRASLLATLNRLRDRPASDPVGAIPLPDLLEPEFERGILRQDAEARRPELAVAEARIAAGQTLIELAEKNFRPDLMVGLSYTAVGRRDDTAGRLNPPEDNGDDILALSGSLHLPIRRQKLAAGIEEAQASRWAAEEEKRQILAQIESSIGDLAARMPLLHQHLELLDNVLLKQAREALRSAETAYSTGKLNAVDLLDAEVVLFEVQIAAARTRADLAIAWAQLERAVGRPLHLSKREPSS